MARQTHQLNQGILSLEIEVLVRPEGYVEVAGFCQCFDAVISLQCAASLWVGWVSVLVGMTLLKLKAYTDTQTHDFINGFRHGRLEAFVVVAKLIRIYTTD